MSLAQVLVGLFGVAIGVNSIAKGAKHLSEGLRDNGPRPRSGRIGGSNIPAVIVPRAATKRMPPVLSAGRKVATKAGPASMTLREVRNLGDRLSIIIDKVNEGSTDPVVVAWARKEVSRRKPGSTAWNGDQWAVKEKDTKGEIFAIHKGLRRDNRYTSDPKTDLYASARRAMATGAFDCDEYSIVGGSALKAIGIDVALEVIQTKDSDSPNHIFILARSEKGGQGGEWIPVDASVNMGPGWRAPDSMVARRWIFETD
jgi:hypothetical protein